MEGWEGGGGEAGASSAQFELFDNIICCCSAQLHNSRLYLPVGI